MKIQIKINKNTLSGVQIGDLLQDLNELTEKDLRKILKGDIHNITIGEQGCGGIAEGTITLINE
tara:strand:- start:244 stop:435 length:192 start_codon:yes stop_codon:yes gene_type:complete